MFYRQLEPYLGHSNFFKLFDELLNTNSTAAIYSLTRSARSLLAARAAANGQTVLFVCADDPLAEEYLDDLQVLSGNGFLLPDLEVLPYEERSPHYSIRAQRIETLAAAVQPQPGVYMVGLRTLLRRQVTRTLFAQNIIALEKGGIYDPDRLASDLCSRGYTATPQVARVGEFARRGGIMDIYAPGQNAPIRLEFFGDEVDSIRPFNLMTQRSSGLDQDKVELLPMREFSYHNIKADDSRWHRIHDEGFYEGVENDTALLLAQTHSFLQWFDPQTTLVILDDWQHLDNLFDEIMEETGELWHKAGALDSLPAPDLMFYSRELFLPLLKPYRRLYVSTSEQIIPGATASLDSPFMPQTVMHSDLGLLEQSVSQKIEEGWTVFIQSDNRSQSKRMRDLLPDYETRITFTIGVLQNGFVLPDARLAVFTDHEIFSRYQRRKSGARFSKEEALTDYETLTPGDYIVHINHGIGIYEGLATVPVAGGTLECLVVRYANNDRIYVPTHQLRLVSRFVSEEGFVPTIHKLGGKGWDVAKEKARKQIELVAKDLVDLYAERSLRRGIAFLPDGEWQHDLEDSFIFEDTPDQARATEEIKTDMEREQPMERLLCGDVGFGKTEVAIRAAFKAVTSGYQVCVLVPTTLLAEQHYFVFKERLAQYPVRLAMFSRFRSPANIKKDLVRLAQGELDVVIGTHRLLSKDVLFKKLGLLIVDEEHRFGVRHKDKLRQMKKNVDTLYMSATPIPRTLNMALAKMKEMSLIMTSPKARLPIRTVVTPHDDQVIKDAIKREIDRGGQVFFLHNRVQTIDQIARELGKLVPGARMRVGHGQMPEKQLEQLMIDFANHQFDVLVCTTIIESGIDIPNANTIIVDRADTFGLAQLYQMRGRVGRSSRRAYAYLIIPKKLEEIARKRLETLTEYNSLGAGFQVAMRDLELRGAGTLLGTRQHGVMNAIGFNYYNRLLEEAIKNLEAKNPGGLWDEEEKPRPVQVDADLYFPTQYLPDDKLRLQFYQRMLGFTSDAQFADLKMELRDRFGPLPPQADKAVDFFRLKQLAETAGLNSCKLFRGVLSLDFPQPPTRSFIESLMKQCPYPVSFDTAHGFKLRVELPNTDGTPTLPAAIELLHLVDEWLKNCV